MDPAVSAASIRSAIRGFERQHRQREKAAVLGVLEIAPDTATSRHRRRSAARPGALPPFVELRQALKGIMGATTARLLAVQRNAASSACCSMTFWIDHVTIERRTCRSEDTGVAAEHRRANQLTCTEPPLMRFSPEEWLTTWVPRTTILPSGLRLMLAFPQRSTRPWRAETTSRSPSASTSTRPGKSGTA